MEKQEQEELIKQLVTVEGYQEIVIIPGRGICGLRAFLYTVGLCYGLDKDGYSGRYCYPKEQALQALIALKTWDGKDHPTGDWIKHKGSVEFGQDEKHQYKFK